MTTVPPTGGQAQGLHRNAVGLVAVLFQSVANMAPGAAVNARGLGTGVGFLVGWAFLLAEVVVAPGGLLILGIVVSTVLHTHLGWPDWTWAPSS